MLLDPRGPLAKQIPRHPSAQRGDKAGAQIQQVVEQMKRGSYARFTLERIPQSPPDKHATCSIHTGLNSPWKLFLQNHEITHSAKVLCLESIALYGTLQGGSVRPCYAGSLNHVMSLWMSILCEQKICCHGNHPAHCKHSSKLW